jgi:hypothetical protein
MGADAGAGWWGRKEDRSKYAAAVDRSIFNYTEYIGLWYGVG